MRYYAFSGLVGLLIAVAAPVWADMTSEMLFQHKNWQVEGVTFDDGTYACLAEVDATSESFTVWAYADTSMRLQFYSTQWEFGEGDTANLQIEIDNRSPWTLSNAELYKNSVLFDLPDSDAGVGLLRELAGGSRLYLRTEAGEDVQNYSLSGSSASMAAMFECVNAIANPGNPFK